MYISEPIEKYLDDLAARLPAPGGGSSAAMSGAMATALISMVLNFTVGNERYKAFEETAGELLARSEALRKNFMKFFEEDVHGYDLVSKAYKLPKVTDAEIIKRKQAVKEALKQATLTPLHVCQNSAEAIRLLPELARSANRNLICDVEVSVRLLEAAFYSARINVLMNLKGIDHEEFNADITKQMAALEKEILKYRDVTEKEISKVTGRGG
ncbi:MAG: cyclodeaminase/cyclohydrolase family protein [Candidatus Omnitrophica bacterium]|nr:cyclodeaminase/cyclohydrolase family protein [Candidatus Omnitrophota bacterium]